jgi:hypothetical protein
MAGQFSITDQKRITFLSLLSSAVQTVEYDLDSTPQEQAYLFAKAWFAQMEDDGFFEGNASAPSSKPSRTSGRQGSSSRNGNRGRDRQGGGGMKDPDGPPTDKQVAFLLKQTNDYTEDEVYDMTKKEVSDLIDDLVG